MNNAVRVEPLGEEHDRTLFLCGVPALDRYFRELVGQDVRRRMASCFVAVAASDHRVLGYYTLSSAGIPATDMPPETVKKLPRYPTLPAIRIGRLAVDMTERGRGIGSVLLIDAARRALRAEAAAFTLLVEAKDDRAVAFYRHHGFMSLAGQPCLLFLPLATMAKLLPVTNEAGS